MKKSIYNRVAKLFVDFLNGDDDSMEFADIMYNLEQNGISHSEVMNGCVVALRPVLMNLYGSQEVVEKSIKAFHDEVGY